MSSEHTFEDKGKVKPKPSQDAEQPQKEERPITVAEMKGELNADKVKRMQQTLGNSAVQRLLAQRSADGPSELDEVTAKAINDERGSGQSLDQGIAQKAGAVMDQDFSNVNVHTGEKADSLNQQLQAKAFTVGSDIFFRDGQYNPGSSEGQELISHELTHVVQQGASQTDVQGKMTVNDPNDQYEAEADAVADTVMNAPDDAQMQDEEELMEKEDPTAQRQEEEEMMRKIDPEAQLQDEEELMEKMDPTAQRQEFPEEEEEEAVQTKNDAELQREEIEGVQMMPGSAAYRQEEEEELPPVQAKKLNSAQRQEELPEETL